MRLGLSYPRRKFNRIAAVFFVLLFLVMLLLFIYIRLQPAFVAYSATYANNIANSIVNKVRYTIESATDLKVSEVNVHIEGIDSIN